MRSFDPLFAQYDLVSTEGMEDSNTMNDVSTKTEEPVHTTQSDEQQCVYSTNNHILFPLYVYFLSVNVLPSSFPNTYLYTTENLHQNRFLLARILIQH